MSEKFKLGVNGAGGRMGQRIVALAHVDPLLTVAAALEAPGSPHIGKDAGELAGLGKIGVPIKAELSEHVDVIIDFSMPAGTVAVARVCGERQIPLVVATTGLEGASRDSVLSASQTTAVLLSPSMSLAVNLTMKLVREAARILKHNPEGIDVEVIERHHRFKEDAPSGTALKFGQIIAEEMGQTEHVHGRHGRPGARLFLVGDEGGRDEEDLFLRLRRIPAHQRRVALPVVKGSCALAHRVPARRQPQVEVEGHQ